MARGKKAARQRTISERAPRAKGRVKAAKASGARASSRQASKRGVAAKSAPVSRYIYGFGGGRADGRADMKNLLGGKGANLAEMASLGLPVPPGFTITTEVCTYFYAHGRRYPQDLERGVRAALGEIERQLGKRFGAAENPLLVSVRSGARASMPGMMDTILNLGLNDTTVRGVAAVSGNERFAYDSYRRFVQMYGDVVLEMKPESKTETDPFEALIEKRKHARGI